MATFTERLQILIDAKTGGAVGEIRRAGGAVDQLGGQSGLADRALNKMGLSGVVSGNMLKAGIVAGAGVAGIAIAKFAAGGVSALVGLAGTVRDLQRVTGASAEEASRFVAVSDDLEISSESLEKAMFRLSRNVTDNRDTLEAQGVQIATNADGTTNLTETLLNASDAYSDIEDPARRAQLVFDLFGRSGAALIPMLEQGRDGLQRFFDSAEEGHQILSQEEVDKAREYEIAVDNLSDSIGGLQRDVGTALVPILTEGADALSLVIEKAQSAAEPVGGLGNLLGTVAKAGLPGVGILTGFAGALESGASIGDRFKSVVTGIIPPLDLLWGSSDKAKTASEQLTGAQDKQNEALGRVLDLQNQGKEGTQEYTDAKNDLGSATTDVTAKEREMAAAFLDVADKAQAMQLIIQGLTNTTLGTAGATLSYQQNLLAIQDAEAQAVVAQDAYNEAVATHGVNSAEAAEADRQRSAAQLAVSAAQLAGVQSGLALDAQIQAEIQAFNNGDISAQRMLTRLQELKTAHPELAAAIQPHIDRVIWLGLESGKLNRTDVLRILAETSGADAAIQSFGARFRAFRDDIERSIPVTTTFGSVAGLPGRQHGGTAKAHNAYVVGEKRAELFVPGVDGTIVPSVPKAFGAAGAASRYSGGITINKIVRVEGDVYDGDRFSEKVDRLFDIRDLEEFQMIERWND